MPPVFSNQIEIWDTIKKPVIAGFLNASPVECNMPFLQFRQFKITVGIENPLISASSTMPDNCMIA